MTKIHIHVIIVTFYTSFVFILKSIFLTRIQNDGNNNNFKIINFTEIFFYNDDAQKYLKCNIKIYASHNERKVNGSYSC